MFTEAYVNVAYLTCMTCTYVCTCLNAVNPLKASFVSLFKCLQYWTYLICMIQC